MRELICLLVQARTARLGRARGASSDLILCSSTALTSHSKLCPLLCPVLSPSSCSVKNVAVNPFSSNKRLPYTSFAGKLPSSVISIRPRARSDRLLYYHHAEGLFFKRTEPDYTTFNKERSYSGFIPDRAHCKVRCSVVRFL